MCDFTKPALAQQPSLAWVSFAGGPGGQPLGEAPASAEISVATRILEQIDLIAGLQGGSFAAQLGGVKGKLDGEQLKAACGQLRAYMNHVKAQAGEALANSSADSLLVNAQGIGVAIGCWN